MGRQVGNEIRYKPRWCVRFIYDGKIVGINYFGTLFKMARYLNVSHSQLCGILYRKVKNRRGILKYCNIGRTFVKI